MLMEQLDYSLLFRWFVGLEIDDEVWHHAVFSKNRDRLLNQEVAQLFFRQVNAQAKGLMSDEHFTVDGTLIEAWASHKSFQRKDGDEGGPDSGRNFHGDKRTNETHESKTDPEARLYKEVGGGEAPRLPGAYGGGEPQRTDHRRHGPTRSQWQGGTRGAGSLMVAGTSLRG